MRKAIDGKLYDTEKATLVADHEPIYDSGNFHYVYEVLYMTKNGNYFLHGEGGAMSEYAVSLGGGSYSGGSNIVAMSPNEARQWLEDHSKTEVLLRHFPTAYEEA